MKKKSQKNEISTLEKQQPQTLNQSGFWKFLCPCIYSKKNQTTKYENKNASYIRQGYYEEQTEVQQNVHESTQANLPVIGPVSQFDRNKNQGINVQITRLEGQVRFQNIQSQVPKTIKFNVKRNNNLQSYLKQQKQQNINVGLGKENNNPEVSSKERYTQNPTSRFPQEKKRSNIQDQRKTVKQKNKLQKIINNRTKIRHEQIISIKQQLQKMQNIPDYEFLQNFQQTYEHGYPINSFQQSKLFVLGSKCNKLLSKVSSVHLFPSSASIERYKESVKNKQLNQKYGKKDINFNSPLDRYWDKRYFLFEKFDEGIKLDEQSWYSVTPEAVAYYVSAKVNVKGTIVDAFCGAGGDAIKLATSCGNLIANDIDEVKLKCLLNNAKIYDANNISISCSDFFNLNMKADAVYLAPPWGGPDYYKIESFHPESFQPKLSLIFQKAFSIAKNVFFLLPANTDVQALAGIIAEKIRLNNTLISESCSLKLEKIYFNERLKFIAGFYGNSQVQTDILLSQELTYIYNFLSEGDTKLFKHKKLVRKVRQQYGMVNLLNFIFQCENQSNQQKNNHWNADEQPLINKFEKYLVSHKIIDLKTLQQIKQEQQFEYQYQLKNRQQRNKRQKSKKIQKLKEKQQRQALENQNRNAYKTENQRQYLQEQLSEGDNDEIPIQQIIQQTEKHDQKVQNYKHKITDANYSNIDSQIFQSPQVPNRDSLRTVSIVSEFHEDQLRNMAYERMTTNSDISILDSINPIQKYQQLDISIEQSGRLSENSKKMIPFSARNQIQANDQNRFSSPAVVSPRQTVKMKKNRVGLNWEKGIIEEVNEKNEKDF